MRYCKDCDKEVGKRFRYCEDCIKIRKKKLRKNLYQNNKEYYKKCGKKYYHDNRDKLKIEHLQYYKKNRDKMLKQKKVYSAANREKISLYQFEYHKKNKDKIKERRKIYYQEHKEEFAERQRKRNRDKSRKKLHNFDLNKEDILNIIPNMGKISQHNMLIYKTAICTCCNPKCKTRYELLETHHIIPTKQGGEDNCLNYISLCHKCHRGLGLHRNWYGWTEKLLKWKLYNEIIELVTTSDEHSHEGYLKILKLHINKD